MSAAVQESLDSLRNTRNVLNEMPGNLRNGWSLEDQIKFADDLHRISQRILQIETIKMTKGNQAFKKQENQLKKASAKLESFSENESNFLLMVRNINNSLGILDEIVELIH